MKVFPLYPEQKRLVPSKKSEWLMLLSDCFMAVGVLLALPFWTVASKLLDYSIHERGKEGKRRLVKEGK